jgi:hypothetical protein
MNEEFTDLQKLLTLKRHETPGEHYFENFLDEFQRRQRAELLQRSARSLLLERVGTYFSGMTSRPLAQGAGVAFAAVAVGGISYFAGAERAELPEVVVEKTEPVSLWAGGGTTLSNEPQRVQVDFSPSSPQFERVRGIPRSERFVLPGGQQDLPSENEDRRF